MNERINTIIKTACEDGTKLNAEYPVIGRSFGIWDIEIPLIADALSHFIVATTQTNSLEIINSFCERGFKIVKPVRLKDGCVDACGVELVKDSLQKDEFNYEFIARTLAEWAVGSDIIACRTCTNHMKNLEGEHIGCDGNCRHDAGKPNSVREILEWVQTLAR